MTPTEKNTDAAKRADRIIEALKAILATHEGTLRLKQAMEDANRVSVEMREAARLNRKDKWV